MLGRPHVTYKVAVSRDGRTAPASGERTWISSPQSRAEVHELRARSGAVAVGIGTVLADDPDLTARDTVPPVEHQPVRVVFDRRGRLPEGSRLVRTAGCRDAGGGRGRPRCRGGSRRRRWSCCGPDSLESALAELADRGIAWLLLEGGATSPRRFWTPGLIDRVLVYQAPVELGPPARACSRTRCELPPPLQSRAVGPDILTEVELREP